MGGREYLGDSIHLEHDGNGGFTLTIGLGQMSAIHISRDTAEALKKEMGWESIDEGD